MVRDLSAACEGVGCLHFSSLHFTFLFAIGGTANTTVPLSDVARP